MRAWASRCTSSTAPTSCSATSTHLAGHINGAGMEVGATRGVVGTMPEHARGRRDPRRRGDRPRHRVVPQRPVGRLQGRRGRRSRAARRSSRCSRRRWRRPGSRCGRWSSSRPTTRSAPRPPGGGGRPARRAGRHLHARQGPGPVRAATPGRPVRPTGTGQFRRRGRGAREVRRRPRVDPRLAGAWWATRPTASRACPAGARSRPAAVLAHYEPHRGHPATRRPVGGRGARRREAGRHALRENFEDALLFRRIATLELDSMSARGRRLASGPVRPTSPAMRHERAPRRPRPPSERLP